MIKNSNSRGTPRTTPRKDAMHCVFTFAIMLIALALLPFAATPAQAATGEISGTPTAAGTANFTVKAANSMGNATQPLSITIKTSASTPTVYVTPAGAGLKDGSDWANAMDGLSNALEAARTDAYITEIWVAAGTYKPAYRAGNGTEDKDKAFVLANGVKIYGGFAGTETALNQRNPAQNITVLSGNLGGGVKSLHVVISSNDVGAACLDGFTVTDGNANGSNRWVTVNQWDIYAGNGGGIVCNRSSPRLANLVIKGNSAVQDGGGMFLCGDASPYIENVLITGNTATVNGGGVCFNEQAKPVFTNITVAANTASVMGSGIYNDADAAYPINMHNSIVWNNNLGERNPSSGSNITYSLVQGRNLPGAGNLYGELPANNPQFVNPSAGDYRLQSTSPCINKGSNGLNSSATDLAWNPRITGTTIDMVTIDMGAYEYAVAPTITTTSLPSGAVGTAYSETLTATGTTPITWSIESGGNLPAGLSLNPATGEISGTPAAASTANFTVKAANTLGDATKALSITIKTSKPTVYVTPAGAGSKDGSNWANAIDGLSNALEEARINTAITEIWVAAGTYKPVYMAGNGTKGEDKAFVLVYNVKIYGGFNGTETSLSQRNPAQNVTVLSGDLGGGVISWHVVISSGDAGDACLDGFTVTGGVAWSYNRWVKVNGYDIFVGSGGGIFCNSSSPRLANLVIKSNSAITDGGGMYICGTASPIVENVLITNNLAKTGGGIYFNEQAVPEFTNITVAGNTATDNGSGIYNNSDTRINMRNSIVWDTMIESDNNFDANITYSLVQGRNLTGTGNLDGTLSANDPQFVYTVGGDYSLQSTSPCINKGSNDLNGSATDLAWNPRITGASIDMGAYEYPVALVAPTITTTSLPRGSVGAIYSQTLTATGTTSITWSIESGTLPAGLSLSNAGVISGTPTTLGTASFTVKAVNSWGYDTKALSITIKALIPTVYVTPNGAGLKDGSNWANAFDGLSNALEEARADATINEIWVAAGTYKPAYKAGNGTEDKDKAFVLVNGVKIYGGFTGTETSLSQRNPAQNVTVLSGDLGGGVKSLHVVISSGNVGTACLDGFTVTDGNANGSNRWVTVNQWDIYAGNGGGIFCNRSSLRLANLVIKGNSAVQDGGGIFLCGNASPNVENVLITGNSAATGGGVNFNEQSVPVFTNITVAGNTASGNGNGIYNSSGTHINMRNSIVWNNTMWESDGSFGDNITYSLVQDRNLTGTGNLDGTLPANDPKFVNAASGDYRLQSASPCINAGSSSLSTFATDLAWNPRIADAAIDMGAYEYTAVPAPPVITTASGALTGGTVDVAYSATLAASNSPTSWAVSSGSLPAGLTLNSGVISGTPTTAETADFSVTAINDTGTSVPVAFSITIAQADGAAVSGVPTVSGTPTAASITVSAVTNIGTTGQSVEYAISTTSGATPAAGWQSGTTFSGLAASTAYYVYARTAANGNYNAGTARQSLAITTGAAPPTTYGVSIGTLSNGNVTASPNANITAGATVTLTITPDAGYELDATTTTPSVTLSGSGNTRTFAMPASSITVEATFKKTAGQTAVETTQSLIEGMNAAALTVAQKDANTKDGVKTWLAKQINTILTANNIALTVSENNITTGNDFIAATAGGAGNHNGANGSFSFTVSLQKGSSATVTTASKNGVITATVFIPTPTAGDLNFTIPATNVYNGSAQGIGTVSGAAGTGTVTIYYTGTGYAKNTVAPANAGTYAVTADITAGTNYTAATGLSLGNYTIGKATVTSVPKEVTVPVNFAQNVNVTLAELLPALTNPMSFGTVAYSLGTVADTDNVLGTVSYTSGNTLTLPVQSVSDANRTATVSITVSSDNFNNFTAVITVKTVATTALSVTGLAVKTKTYDGNTAATLEGTATLSGVQTGHDVTLSGTPSATFDNKNAGTNKTVTVSGLTLTGADAHWYHLDLSGFTGEISPKTLANGMIGTISGQTYNGTEQTPALTVTDGALGALVLNTDYENATYSSNTNAGTASASITGKGNYTGTASANFSIAPATITASSATLAAKTYDGTTAGTASGLTFTGLQNNETLTLGTDFTATATYNTADAGTNRGATVTVTLSGTAKADNYQLAASGNTVSLSNQTIGKATTSGVNQTKGVEKNRAQNVSFDLTTLWTQPANPKTLGTVTYSPVITANTDGVLGTLSYNNNTGNILTLPVQSVSDAGKTATVTVTVGSTNYADITATITVKTEDTQDDADIATAKSHVEGENYTTTQVNAPTQAAAKTVVQGIINALGSSLNGVTPTVIDGTFTAAKAGTPSDMDGTNGSYTFTVTLSKGYGTPQTIGTLTLAITATPYDATQDNTDITAAKTAIETATYTDTQVNVPNATAAKAKVEAIITGLTLNGVTPTVVPGAFNPAIAGTPSNMNGTNGSYKFTVNLNKGGGAQQTTISLTLTVIATPYDPTQDNADITAAKALVENATYTDTQVNIPDAAAAEAKVKTVIAGLSLNGVTATVAGGTFSPAIAGTATNLSGTNGSYKFTVNLNKGGGTQQTTVQLTLTVIATPYDATQDNADITAAKALVENAGYTDTQANIPDAARAKAKVEAVISGLALNGVTLTVVPGAFTPAIAGTVSSLSGTNGSYTFTVKLNKGGGTEQTTIQLTLSVIATPYDATQDNADISAAKILVQNAVYTDTQVNVPDVTAAKAKVAAIIAGLSLNGVTTTVIDGAFTPAIAGTASNLSGTNGSYKFTVNLNKGAGTQQTTVQLTLNITATPYDATQDNADIAAAKAAIEGAAYTDTQANVPDAEAATAAVKAIFSTLNLNGVTATVVPGSFTAATAGNAGNPTGTNGSYTFTVNLNKGGGTQQTTISLTLAVTATPHTPPNTYLVNVSVTTNGTVTKDKSSATAGETITLTISPATGYELNTITAHKDGDAATSVALNGTGNTRTFNMPTYNVTVNATFKKTADQLAVEAAKTAIEGMNNVIVAQATANTEAAVKSWLVTQINALAGMSATGITVVAANITLGNFTAAVAGNAGNLPGTNGSFTFTVSLKKGNSTTVTTASRNGTVTATPYDATQDNADITAVKALVENATYTDTQVNIPDAEAAKAKVQALIDLLNLNGVTPTVISGTFTPAIAGTVSNLSGTNGSYKFTVNLNKGAGTQQTTVQLTLNITATPYDATQDNADIAAAKAAIEGATYTDTQANVPDAEAATAAVKAIFSTLNLNGVTATVVPGSFTAATAGNAGNPQGTNGSYTFTVNLNKGGGTQQTTVQLTLTVTATPHTPPNTYLVNVSVTTNGTVTKDKSSATAGETITLTISPATGYELNTITAHKDGDAATSVALNGTGNTRTFTMPAYDVTVNATFKKTTDQSAVETAQSIIEGMNNATVAQETANTEASVKSWLAAQINALQGMSTTGITVSASDITLSGFSAAEAGNAGNPSGTNGSFTFTVSLQKGNSATVTTAGINGTITATAYIAPTYAVTIGATTNGTVSANPDANITEGTTVTLTITPNAGYELDAITAHKTGDVSVTVSLNGFNVLNALNGNFEMPAFDVTITATFKKTQAQLDREAVEAAKAAIEGGTYRIAQATGNDAASVKTWLASTLNVLFGQSHGLQVKSAQPSIVGDVTITAITPAMAGTENAPNGVNGSFTFSVSLARGSATATATFANGVIIATPHASTPVKRIEVLYLGNLKARILNTGNIATGDLTLALSGTNADVFTISQATVNSLAAGSEADITLIPRANLAAGTYTATLTVSGEGIAETATVTYTVTPTGIDSPQANALKAYVQNGLLHVSGLTVGKTWSIYSISGALIYQNVAREDKADFNLSIRGVYIVTSGNKTVKVIY